MICSGHGACVEGSGAASCDCDDGYTAEGLTCVALPDPCAGVTCSDHGVCRVQAGVASCHCVTGYTASGLSCLGSHTGAGSCTISVAGSLSACLDYTGSYWSPSVIASACAEHTYATGACSAANLIGTCLVEGATTSRRIIYYYQGYGSDPESTCVGVYEGVFTRFP